jgi:hypothetical protein
MTYRQVRDAVMALGKRERRKLRKELETLDEPVNASMSLRVDDQLTEEQFRAELKRRIDEAERNPTVLIAWDDAERRWRELAK